VWRYQDNNPLNRKALGLINQFDKRAKPLVVSHRQGEDVGLRSRQLFR
jgi:hypothetical protein